MLWLWAVHAMATSCAPIDSRPALVDPAVVKVPADYHPVLRIHGYRPKAGDPPMVLRAQSGEPVAATIRWTSSGGLRWAEFVPAAPLKRGSSYEVIVGESQVSGQFTVGSTLASPPPSIRLDWVNQNNARGEHYTFAGPHVPSFPMFGGTSVWLSVAGPTWAGRLQIQYAHNDKFRRAESAWTPAAVGRTGVGSGLCGPSTARFEAGRRTFFRVRAVALDGDVGPWSDVGSLEIGNLDSEWPPRNLGQYGALSRVEYAIRAAIVVAAVLLCLLGWMALILVRRMVQRRWEQRSEPK